MENKTLKELNELVKKNSDSEKAKILQRFFKTGKGEYGEGDEFYGITVPVQRKIAKDFFDLGFDEIEKLLSSKIHEKRLIGLLILVDKYKKSDENSKKQIFMFYLKSASNNQINNWDLVDLTAPNIAGEYLINRERKILYELANSQNLWEKRISIISTLAFIRKDDFDDCLRISEILLKDKHDLIHKAVGWMLRETGKRNKKVLEEFLKKHYKEMPRTMLRYAIEKFPEEERKKYLENRV